MRFIQKTTPLPCLMKLEKEHKTDPIPWHQLQNPCKRNTVKRMLNDEQFYLCCYCEIRISEDDAHIEHIEHQSGHSAKRFDYNNLIVYCHGKQCTTIAKYTDINAYRGIDIHSCGHKKDNLFDAIKFLNPVTV